MKGILIHLAYKKSVLLNGIPILPQNFGGELPAIMGWMLDGYREWQAQGLNPPASVLADSSDFISRDDPFLEWKSERCCDVKLYGSDIVATLHRSYCDWAESNRLTPISRRDFATLLDDHDVERHKLKYGYVTKGFELTVAERERISGQREMGSK